MSRLGIRFEHDADAHLARVERYGIREQEEHHDGQYEGDEQRGRVAEDLQRFLARDRREAAKLEGWAFDRAASCASKRLISSMKASSIVGS